MTKPYAGKRVLIAGGGTGGHVYPGLAVAQEWTEGGGTAAFVGVPGNLEFRVVPAAGYSVYPVEVRGFTRGRSLADRLSAARALLLLLTLTPLRQALRVLSEFRPDAVLGIGGYVSGPALLAAKLSGVPTMMLQLDAYPGIANRLASLFVDVIGIGIPEVQKWFRRQSRVRLVGNPIRPEVVLAAREEGRAAFELQATRQTLLIFGGSLGSRAINEAAVGALRRLGRLPGWGSRRQVIHVTGRAHPISLPGEEAAAMGLIYLAMPYCDQMPLALAAADLAVCRAGAITLAELTARGLASILIPWSGAADNHQEGNARALERRGAARVILDKDLAPETLAVALEELLESPVRLDAMATASKELGIPDAASRVAVELLRAIG